MNITREKAGDLINCMSYIDYVKDLSTKLNDKKTEAEIIFEEALQKTMLPYKSNKIVSKRYCYNERKNVIKYIVDFLILGMIVVEVDGGYHNTNEQQQKDKERDEWLRDYGFKVYRIKNEDVFNGESIEFLRNICKENDITYCKSEGKYNCKKLRKRHLAKIKEYKIKNNHASHYKTL